MGTTNGRGALLDNMEDFNYQALIGKFQTTQQSSTNTKEFHTICSYNQPLIETLSNIHPNMDIM